MEDKILEAFKFGTLQECLSIKRKLDEHNISWDEFTDWMKDTSHRLRPIHGEAVIAKVCPECKSLMRLFQVNTPNKSTEVGGDFKSQWQCIGCGYDIFNKSTTQEELEELK